MCSGYVPGTDFFPLDVLAGTLFFPQGCQTPVNSPQSDNLLEFESRPRSLSYRVVKIPGSPLLRHKHLYHFRELPPAHYETIPPTFGPRSTQSRSRILFPMGLPYEVVRTDVCDTVLWILNVTNPNSNKKSYMS